MMDLKKYIRDVKDFPRPGIMFKDISPLLADHDAFTFAIKKMVANCDEWTPSLIGAFDARGFLFGNVIAAALEVPFFMLRKKGKLPPETISVEYGLEYEDNKVLEVNTNLIVPGDRIVLVDDVIATGGTAEAGCKLVKRLSGNVVGCQFLIELDEMEGRQKLLGVKAIDSLIHY